MLKVGKVIVSYLMIPTTKPLERATTRPELIGLPVKFSEKVSKGNNYNVSGNCIHVISFWIIDERGNHCG